MKKISTLLLLGGFGVFPQANSMTLTPVSSVDGADVSINYSISNNSDNLSNTFLSDEAINFKFNIAVGKNDIGKTGKLYLLAQVNTDWYQYTASGWQVWDQQDGSLQPFKSKTLEQKERIKILKNNSLSAGEYLVYAGYQVEGDDEIFYNSSSASMVVFNEKVATLHQVKNKLSLANFFAHGSSFRGNPSIPPQEMMPDSADASPVAATPTPPPVMNNDGMNNASSTTSQTNLQEVGVDEADRVKTDGEQLYALENCESDRKKQCIASYTIQANPATNIELGQLEMNAGMDQNGDEFNQNENGSLYLSEINDKKHLIHLDNSSNFGVFDSWYAPSNWQNNKTDITFVDISQPENMQAKTHVSIDAALVSSRLVDGVLYLVTRKNPYFDFPLPVDSQPIASPPTDVIPPEPTSEPVTVSVEPVDPTQPAPVYNPQVPDNQSIEDLLPIISIDDVAGVPAVQATDCYIPNQNSHKFVDNTLMTVTAIPLDKPDQYYSTCIAGNIDTFYVSTKALYLTSSRHPVSMSGGTIFYEPGDSEMETEIHKFSLGEGKLDYRGSGAVQGHLGWDADKQSFRMGEHDGVLKIATSKGNTWDETSTSSVTALREAADSQTLEIIGTLDNLGKPGEKLYAARFIGARGYLVTFKQIDPLFVVDFTEPEQPKILGELEVNGFSDYLQPIGENYLLGIGKDAIAVEGEDAAWYQGVKVSLFDVSDGDNLREVESIVLGKRGTETTVSTDHHGLAWLPSGDSSTLAIPVQLNEQESSEGFDDYSQPSAFYNWTHTGLYTFNINTGDNPGIELEGKLITDTPPEICNEPGNSCSFIGEQIYNDRAVIQEDSVHYIHNNAVHSSALDDLN